MVKDHSDSEKGNPLPPPRLLFPISSKGSFICIIPDRITHTMAFVTPVVDHWLEWDIAQWVQDRSDHLPYHVDIYHWAMSRTSLNCALYWDMIFDYFLSNILSTLPCAEIWFPYYYNYYSVLHKTTQQTCVCVCLELELNAFYMLILFISCINNILICLWTKLRVKSHMLIELFLFYCYT